jgi:hypothetical protein
MNRYAVALTLTLTAALTLAASARAQQVLQPPTAPAPVSPLAAQPLPPAAGQQVFIERESAQETRNRLHELLRQHPPAVGEVLQRDPTLARQEYLAAYPALLNFIQQHPEVARNPSFFFGGYEFRDDQPRDRSYDMFRHVTDMFQFMLIGGAVLAVFVWLVRSTIDQRRWLRVSRTQAEVHTKLLDRLTNNEDLISYIQTPAGRRFLESGPLLTEGDPTTPVAGAPLSRIILSLQAGVVLASLGIGFWISQSRFPEDMGEGFFIIGTLATALGLGFVVSAALAYVISSRFGLVVPTPPVASHD